VSTVDITIDRECCIGAAQCVLAAPEVYTQDDGAIGEVIEGHGASAERAREGARACPVQAILVSGD
jgi:ferredoxin